MNSMEEITHSVGVLLIKNKEEVLLVKHGKSASHITNTYGLPAGRLQENESELKAAIREFKEETGLITSQENLIELPDQYFAKIKRKNDTKTFSLKVYLCNSYSGELKATDETQPLWIKIKEIDKYKLLPNIKNIVIKGLSYKI
jgi:8-oxo-dGTP diphosphatase